jgi:glycosyltransferase involved in cell wall biosynthesis
MPADHIMTYALGLDGGGVERAQLRLVREWVAAGRRVTLVLGRREGALADQIAAGTEVIEIGTTRYLALVAALPRIVRDTQPDLIFCPGNFYTSAVAAMRMRLGLASPPIVAKMSNAAVRADHGKLVDTAHGVWLGMHGRFLDSLVAMTPATAETAARMMRMEGRVTVIPNPPPPSPPTGTAAVPLPAARVILGVGRLAQQKRWDRLIDAMPSLPADVALMILGEGPLRGALAEQVAALGLGERVSMPGQVEHPAATMAAARVVALTSDYEGVPGVLREALSVGTPVVSTASSEAIAEVVTSPVLGTIVAHQDRDALVAALTHWLDAPRPEPVPLPGGDSAARYLALFDSLV